MDSKKASSMTCLLAKVCRRCGIEKPLDEYYVHSMMLDGHLNFCKPCVKARVRKHRRENDSVRQYDRNRPRTEAFKQWEIERARMRHLERPLKKKAHAKIAYAIRMGRIVRKPCEDCGSRAEAHHDDYSKPYDVRWLCSMHHKRWHAENQAYYPVPF